MKRSISLALLLLFSVPSLWAQNQASAIFLLIAPGASAGGTGEAGVAVANDAYASYWNPAALAYIPGQEVVYQTAKWLPGLVDDIRYNFIGMRKEVPGIGTFGAHLIYLDLGEQIQTDAAAVELGVFSSYMAAFTVGFGTKLSNSSAVGFNVKLIHQKLSEVGAGAEEGKGSSTDFAFDLSYYKRGLLLSSLDFGMMIANVGDKIAFIDVRQADPAPTLMKIGIKWRIIETEFNRLSFLYDINKMLVASWLSTDLDADGAIGGYTKDGVNDGSSGYNAAGQHEVAHTDPWYKALVTSWLDDWYYKGSVDEDHDGVISEDEEGNNANYSFSSELISMVHNVGLEYWYSQYFAIRLGYINDRNGKIYSPTFGAGIHYGGYGFDFGYIYGEQGHPLTNTMRFSLNIAL
ncbi:MAG: PorV/PorQ family protein [Candidatus Marinimicrobia bacterium]|nr:PorV/PorQ family protein [Candidatus Neomarinimicrobiota bacterium]